jgi:Ca2+-binding RTX toxin-like protein
MATQFAINEPDSFNSPNATYARLPGSEYVAYTLVPSDIMVGYGTIDYIGDRDYFNTPLPAFRTVVGVLLINGKTHYTFGETVFYGTVTVNVVANNGSPFDGVLTLYAGDGSSVVATGTSLGSGETFLQFNGEGAHSEYTLELQENGNDQTGAYTIFVNVVGSSRVPTFDSPGGAPSAPLYRPTTGDDVVTGGDTHDLLVGGGGNDVLSGLGGRDVLNGGPGADTLQGGADDDLYVYIDATDTVVEQPGAGNDTIWTREVSFTLPANVENLLLVEGSAAWDGIGNELDNVITGNAAHNGLVGGDGNDTLIGGLSDDAMFGGFGNDTYSVDNASDLVGEPFGGGFDTVRSSLPAYVLADGLEALILDPGATWALGNASDNTLVGNGISNYLIGYGGNDSLTGVGGDASNDTMIGGLGDDTYHLDSAGDEAIENAGEGSDIIISEAAAYTLPSNVEAMFLGVAGVWGFGNESDNTLAGSSLRNYLFGRGGNDYLNGGGGQDYLEGGAGADVFLFARGEANGDTVGDFTPGQDRLGFIGYGLGGNFVQVDATHWAVNSADGTTHETITFSNAPAITPADFFFI